MGDKTDRIVEEFFSELKVQHNYYSIQLKQPVLLVGEKHLYKAIKEAISKALSL